MGLTVTNNAFILIYNCCNDLDSNTEITRKPDDLPPVSGLLLMPNKALLGEELAASAILTAYDTDRVVPRVLGIFVI